MGNGLLIYMMVMDARQRNEANRAISIGKRHTDCPTHPPSLSANGIKLKKRAVLWIAVDEVKLADELPIERIVHCGSGGVGFDDLEGKASCPYYCKGVEDLDSLGVRPLD